jgi:hypothetical protein
VGPSRTVVAVGNERRGAVGGCRGPKDGEGAFCMRIGGPLPDGAGGAVGRVCPDGRAAWAARAGKVGGAIRPGLDEGGSTKLGLALGSTDRRVRLVGGSFGSVKARFGRSD